MRRERSKKRRMERGRGGNGKRDECADFIWGVDDLLPARRVAPVGVENPNQAVRLQSSWEGECGRAKRGREEAGRGLRGERWRENVQIFSLKWKISEMSVKTIWRRRCRGGGGAHEKRLLPPRQRGRDGERGAGFLVGAVSDADPFPRWPHWTVSPRYDPPSPPLLRWAHFQIWVATEFPCTALQSKAQ